MTGKERDYRNNGSGGTVPPEIKTARKEITRNTRIFICSPYRPVSSDPEEAGREQAANIMLARLACRFATALGFHVLCPHLYFTNFLQDGDAVERGQGLSLAQEWLLESDAVWVFGDRVSEGMRAEIEAAGKLGIPVHYIQDICPMLTDLLNSIQGMGDDAGHRVPGNALEHSLEHSLEQDAGRREEAAHSGGTDNEGTDSAGMHSEGTHNERTHSGADGKDAALGDGAHDDTLHSESKLAAVNTVSITKDDLLREIQSKFKKDRKNQEKVRSILLAYGASGLSLLPEEKYADFLNDVRQL